MLVLLRIKSYIALGFRDVLNMYNKLIFLFIVILTSFRLLAQEYRPLPGTIPLNYGGFPAADLVYKNKALIPSEAHKLYQKLHKETGGVWNLSDLDPQENDLWKNVSGQSVENASDELISINPKIDEVKFASFSLTRSENYRFTIEKDGVFYQAYMGPQIHNFFIRRNLLRKLGYTVPGIKYIQNIKVGFPNKLDREDFLLDFQASVGRDISRWITSSPEDENYFYAQDLIVMEDQSTIPNLALGFLAEETIDNRRIFKSLILPFGLTDVPESINMFSWIHGRIFSENVIFPFEFAEDFHCSSDDAKWMAKRILHLSEKDWEEIAFNSHLPEPVSMLLFEKLKSRRNHLSTLFQIPSRQFIVNDQISDENNHLKDGLVTEEFFSGFGRRFKIPDPESPLSYGEVMSMIKAKGIEEGLNLLMSSMNSFLTNNLTDKIAAINQEVGVKAKELINSGKSLKSLVKGYALPTVNGTLTVSREIVAGSYLGTNNLIQLVDTLGIGISGGFYGGLAGVYAQTGQYVPSIDGRAFLPVSIGASSSISFNRSYAHIKPITSVKKALKYPFKNLMIPLLKNKQSKKFKELGKIDFEKINALSSEEREKEIQEIFSKINENIEVGESLIITDYASLNAGADLGMNLYNVVDLRARAAASTMILSRLHILRKSDVIFQIYKDFGNNNNFDLALGLSKYVPIVKFRFKKSKGSAETKFTSLRVEPGRDNFKKSVLALSQVLKQGSLSQLNELQKPYVINHHFKENNLSGEFLILNWNQLRSGDKITVTSPGGEKKNFFRQYQGSTIGLNFESYTRNLLEFFQSKLVSTNFSPLSFDGGSNIGYSFFGRAFNKVSVLEGELREDKIMTRPYVSISRIWNGWQIKKKKSLKILNKIKERYQFNFVPSLVLAQTKKIFLYNFSVTLFVHTPGIEYFSQLNKEKLEEIYRRNQSRDMTSFQDNEDALKFSHFKKMIRLKKRYDKFLKAGEFQKASKLLLRCLNIIEDNLTTKGYEEMFGGIQNFLLSGKIDGFRIGDGRGDEAITMNTLGSIGNDSLSGPTSDILKFFKQSTGETMTEGEFFISWILGKVL